MDIFDILYDVGGEMVNVYEYLQFNDINYAAILLGTISITYLMRLLIRKAGSNA